MTRTAPSWMRTVLLAAAVYNVLWGAAVVFFPVGTLGVIGVEPPRYPQLWQVIGMIVGVYGIGYAIAAIDPFRHWPIVLVGFLGKTFGPIGYASGIIAGALGLPYPGVPADGSGSEALPAGFGWTIIPNDLIWWPFFAAILWATFRHATDPRTRFGERPALTLDEALDRPVLDGEPATLRALSRDRRVLVVFLRHAGCVFCREAIADLGAARARLDDAAVRTVIVHQGQTHDGIRRFVDAAGLSDAALVSDPAAELYEAFELRRGRFAELLGPRVWWRGLLTFLRGHRVGGLDGDGLRMPGTFVLENGAIIHAHRHRDASDRSDYASMACGVAGAPPAATAPAA